MSYGFQSDFEAVYEEGVRVTTFVPEPKVLTEFKDIIEPMEDKLGTSLDKGCLVVPKSVHIHQDSGAPRGDLWMARFGVRGSERTAIINLSSKNAYVTRTPLLESVSNKFFFITVSKTSLLRPSFIRVECNGETFTFEDKDGKERLEHVSEMYRLTKDDVIDLYPIHAGGLHNPASFPTRLDQEFVVIKKIYERNGWNEELNDHLSAAAYLLDRDITKQMHNIKPGMKLRLEQAISQDWLYLENVRFFFDKARQNHAKLSAYLLELEEVLKPKFDDQSPLFD